MNFSQRDRDLILADAETLVPGLKRQLETGNSIPEQVIKRLQTLQQQHPARAERIGNILALIQATIHQQVQAVQAGPQTLKDVPDGEDRAKRMINAARTSLTGRPGSPHDHAQTLAPVLYKKNPKKVFALFMDLAGDGRDLRDPVLLALALALEIIIDTKSPSWKNDAPGKIRVLKTNIAASSSSPETISVPVQNPPGNVRGPGGTRRDSMVDPAAYHPPTQNLNGGSHVSSAPAYNPVASYSATPVAHPPTQDLGINHDPTSAGNPAPVSLGGFNFDALGQNMLTGEDPFGAPAMGTPMPAPQNLDWYQKEKFQVFGELSALSAECEGALEVAGFQAKCAEVFATIVEKNIYGVAPLLEEMLRNKPTQTVVIMMQSLMAAIMRQLNQLKQRASSDSNFLQTYKKIEEQYALVSRRVELAPRILHYITQFQQAPGLVLSELNNLENQELTPDVLANIEAIKVAYDRCDKQTISGRLAKIIQKNIQVLDARSQLAPVLLKGKGERRGGWKLGRFLAAGGMGTVFIAEEILFDNKTGKLAAIKVSQSDDEMNKKGFFREARLLSGVKGNHIVQVYAAGMTDAENPYLVMEYVPGHKEGSGAYDGHAFYQMVVEAHSNGNKVPVDALAIINWKMALGVQEYQRQGIVQRDLKPANFLMTPEADAAFAEWGLRKDDEALINTLHELIENGNALIKWTDFGLAKKTRQQPSSGKSPDQLRQEIQQQVHVLEKEGAEVERSFSLTNDGEIVGTPGYMPPETANGEPEDEYTDQFALGVMFYEYLTGGAWPSGKKPQQLLPLLGDGINHMHKGHTHYVDENSPKLSHVREHPRASRLAKIAARLTSLKTPSERGSIDDLVTELKEIAMSSSPKARAARAAEEGLADVQHNLQEAVEREDKALFEARKAVKGQSSLRNKLIALGLTSGALLLSGLLYFANMRSEESIGYGKQRIAWVEKASELDGKTLAELRLLLADLEALEDAEPAGYTEEGDEPKDSSLRRLRRSITSKITEIEAANAARVAADRLIAEGDALLAAATPNYNGARAKYRSAQQRCAERRSVVTRKLEAVDRAEVRSLYASGLNAFRGGQDEAANTAFANIAKLSSAGLSDNEQTALSSMIRGLTDWPQRKDRLERAAVEAIGWVAGNRNARGTLAVSIPKNFSADAEAWTRLIDQQITRAKEGNGEALYSLLLSLHHVARIHEQAQRRYPQLAIMADGLLTPIYRRLSEEGSSLLPLLSTFPELALRFQHSYFRILTRYGNNVNRLPGRTLTGAQNRTLSDDLYNMARIAIALTNSFEQGQFTESAERIQSRTHTACVTANRLGDQREALAVRIGALGDSHREALVAMIDRLPRSNRLALVARINGLVSSTSETRTRRETLIAQIGADHIDRDTLASSLGHYDGETMLEIRKAFEESNQGAQTTINAVDSINRFVRAVREGR